MKKVIAILVPIFNYSHVALSQCAMCKVNAEQATQNGNQQAMWMNNGILILMFVPLIIMVCFYLLWRRNQRGQK